MPFTKKSLKVVRMSVGGEGVDGSFSCCGINKKYAQLVVCSKCDIPVKVGTAYRRLITEGDDGFQYILCRHCNEATQKMRKRPGGQFVICEEKMIDKGDGVVEIVPERTASLKDFSTEILVETVPEPAVICSGVGCGMKMHKLCVDHFDIPRVDDKKFFCEGCRAQDSERTFETIDQVLKVEDLMKTPLSNYIENAVNNVLLNNVGVENYRRIHVRVLSCVPKIYQLQAMVAEFVGKYGIPNEFPYKKRMILCFQEVGPPNSKSLAYFAMYAQEYGPDAPIPNRNSIYISVIDSAKFLYPSHMRRFVNHEILMRYIEYSITWGAENAYLWACTPRCDTEYVFYRRPSTQGRLSTAKLIEWYKKLMQKCLESEIITEWKELRYVCAQQNPWAFFQNFPLFSEDWWPEQIIRIIEEVRSGKITDRVDGKAKRDRKKKRNSVPDSEEMVPLPPEKDEDTLVFENIFWLLNKQRNFFCMTLNVDRKPDIVKGCLNPRIESKLGGSRDYLVRFFQAKDLRFGNTQEALYSTKRLLYGLFCEGPRYYCDICTCLIIKGKLLPGSDVCICTDCFKNYKLDEALAENPAEDIWVNTLDSKNKLLQYVPKEIVLKVWCQQNQDAFIALTNGFEDYLADKLTLDEVFHQLSPLSRLKGLQIWAHLGADNGPPNGHSPLKCVVCSTMIKMARNKGIIPKSGVREMQMTMAQRRKEEMFKKVVKFRAEPVVELPEYEPYFMEEDLI